MFHIFYIYLFMPEFMGPTRIKICFAFACCVELGQTAGDWAYLWPAVRDATRQDAVRRGP